MRTIISMAVGLVIAFLVFLADPLRDSSLSATFGIFIGIFTADFARFILKYVAEK
jgi:hypothetical protein